MPPILRTDRLILRPYAPADVTGFVELFGDPSVTRWMGMPGGPLEAVFQRGLHAGWDLWAVCEGDTYLGHAEIKPSPEPQIDGYELVYALRPIAWGRGLGREVAAAVTTYGLQTLGLDCVHATVDPANTRSLALLRTLGYLDAGLLIDADGEVSRHLTRRANT